MSTDLATRPVTFAPGLQPDDLVGRYWLQQATIRLRREICWLWRERGALAHDYSGTLPPFANKLVTALDLTRYAEEKELFFADDETARYLSDQLDVPPPLEAAPPRGSFAWVVDELELSPAACFVFALALLPVVDSPATTVMAACLNDPTRTHPTLALAQRLWFEAAEVLPLSDTSHPLFRFGLIQSPGATAHEGGSLEWEAALSVSAPCARKLLFRETRAPSPLRRVLAPSVDEMSLPATSVLVAARLKARTEQSLRVVPIVGPRGAPLAEFAAGIAALAGRPLVTLESSSSLATLAWLQGCYVFLASKGRGNTGGDDRRDLGFPGLPSSLPLTIFLGVENRAQLPSPLPLGWLPSVTVPPMTYQARYDRWCRQLGKMAVRSPRAVAVAECARQFRCERATIDAVAQELLTLDRPWRAEDLLAACRAETTADIGDLAQPVHSRFTLSELKLPPKQQREIDEIVQGMRALTRVHYDWGTARAWNESGLCALFAGPPGTGKTMTAEALATELGLPMYRIDLSQVVNKYIGETEKNLSRIFNAAEASDVMLFFDEADALFGKRTEVKDAHDRYANLEISYLLERMERFKGLGILATNRKQDLDEAFLRRLRFIVDFPLPAEGERLRIWQSMIPAEVDSGDIDFDFLARQFPLAGGHIRSIVFNACLQSARAARKRRLTMRAVLVAVDSEHRKLNRSLSPEQFGPYKEILTVS